MKKKLISFLIIAIVLILTLPSAALAGSWVEIEGESASIRLTKADEYTFVTPAALEENMDLCLAHGGTEHAARERFGTGHVVWEAYHPKIEGRVRLEIYEDEWTHYAWDSQTMSLSLMRKLGDDLLEAGWLADHYNFMELKYRLSEDMKFLWGTFNTVPPFDYESGRCAIHFYNGKAFMILYGDSKPASTVGLWSDKAREMLGGNSPLSSGSYFRRDSKALANAPHMTDLLPDRTQLILNLNSGSFDMKGITEKGASVTLEAGGRTADAAVNETEYKGRVTLNEGDGQITIRAQKNGQPENVIEMPLPAVTDSKAALILTQYPIGYVNRDDLHVKGMTNPEAAVSVTIDGNEPIRGEVKADGSFDIPYEASDWEDHTIVITASQEGKEDCTAEFPFIPTYEDAEKGSRAYRKTLDEQVHPVKLSENPEDYVGKRLSFEIKVDGWTIQEGLITMDAHFGSMYMSNGKSFLGPICLIFDSYADDYFRKGQELTVMGEMLEPTLTDPSYPRMQVRYAIHVIGGSRW